MLDHRRAVDVGGAVGCAMGRGTSTRLVVPVAPLHGGRGRQVPLQVADERRKK